jgi:hypothetical protein
MTPRQLAAIRAENKQRRLKNKKKAHKELVKMAGGNSHHVTTSDYTPSDMKTGHRPHWKI